MQWAHCLMVDNRGLPVTEAHLEPSQNSTMKLFHKNS